MAEDDKSDEKLLVLPLGEESKLITQTIANDTARQILELLAEGAMSTSAIAKKLDIPLTTAQYNVEKLIEAKLVVVEKTKYSEKGREVKLYAPAKRMIVLVPANTPRQAIMDVLRKYLVLVPVAGFIAVMVELAMAFLNGNLPGNHAASLESDNALLASAGYNLSSTGASDANAAAPGYLPAPGNWLNVSDGYLSKSADGIIGHISGHVTGFNITPGIGPANAWIAEAYRNVNGDAYISDTNRSVATSPGISNAIPQPAGDSSGIQGLIPPDLLNHYGLWFFVGCLLIIGMMIAYEMYRGRKKR